MGNLPVNHKCPRCGCDVFIPGGEAISYSVQGKRKRRGDAVRCARCTLIFAAGDFGVIEPKPLATTPPPEAPNKRQKPNRHVGDPDIVDQWQT